MIPDVCETGRAASRVKPFAGDHSEPNKPNSGNQRPLGAVTCIATSRVCIRRQPGGSYADDVCAS